MRVLRPGGIAADEIEQAAGVNTFARRAEGIQAPGMLASLSLRRPARRVSDPNGSRGSSGRSAAGPSGRRGSKAPRMRWRHSTCRRRGDLRGGWRPIFFLVHGGARSVRGPRSAFAVEPIPNEDGWAKRINDRLAMGRLAPRDPAGTTPWV